MWYKFTLSFPVSFIPTKRIFLFAFSQKNNLILVPLANAAISNQFAVSLPHLRQVWLYYRVDDATNRSIFAYDFLAYRTYKIVSGARPAHFMGFLYRVSLEWKVGIKKTNKFFIPMSIGFVNRGINSF